MEEDDAIAGIDEFLGFDPVLGPGLLDLLVVPPDLVDAAQDAASLDAADRRMLLNVRIDECRGSLPIPPRPAVGEPLNDF